MKRRVNIGDMAICSESEVVGRVIRFYTPTACEEQTLVLTDDGRQYHAPTRTWVPYKDGLKPDIIIYDEEAANPKWLRRNPNIGREPEMLVPKATDEHKEQRGLHRSLYIPVTVNEETIANEVMQCMVELASKGGISMEEARYHIMNRRNLNGQGR